ncbi:MAG: neutral/alkaline non-lysosomal ceramidase N-terminal domain-containing protein [Planctomycetales bacterium]
MNPKISRRQFTSTTAAVAAVAIAPGIATAAASKPQLQAGAAEHLITPSNVKETLLVGPNDLATGVHDDLFVRTLVLDDQKQRIAIVTIDLLVMHMDFNDVLVNAISAASGIPFEKIVINTNHTHNAPLPGLISANQSDPTQWSEKTPYKTFLVQQVVKNVKAAIDNLQSATLRAGREPTQVGFNRRTMGRTHVTMAPNPNGPIVPWVDVVGAYADDGTRIAVLFSHAAHPVIIHGSSRLISADYPGLTIQKLHHRFSGGKGRADGVFMFAQGCGGDINGHPLLGGIEACQAVSKQLEWAVARVDTQQLPTGAIKTSTTELALPFQDPPTIEQCEQWIAERPKDDRFKHLLAFLKTGQRGTLRYPITGFAVGDLCIVSLAHEPVCSYQLFTVDKSPFKHTLVFGYTHGVEQYIATKKDYELGHRGGYEAAPHGHALQSKHRLALHPDAEQMIHDGITRVLGELQPA